MSRLYRTIKTDAWMSESMGRLTRDARLLFIGLITEADDAGRQRAAMRVLAARIFPYDGISDQTLEAWLDELEREEMIVRYEVNGTNYIQIVNWEKHQVIDRPTKSRIPEQPGMPALSVVPREQSREVASPSEDSREVARTRAGCGSGKGIGIGGGEGGDASEEADSPTPPPQSKNDEESPKQKTEQIRDWLKTHGFDCSDQSMEEWRAIWNCTNCKDIYEVLAFIRYARKKNKRARYWRELYDLFEDFNGILKNKHQQEQEKIAV